MGKEEVPKGTPTPGAPEYTKEPGPQEGRKCQDLFWLFLFILFWIGMFVISGLAIAKGDVNRLRYGTDSFGNQCASKNEYLDATNLPMLYYFQPGVQNTYKRCVASCPQKDMTSDSGAVICQYGVTYTSPDQISSGLCVPALISNEVLNRCVPEVSSYIAMFPSSSDNSSSVGDILLSEIENQDMVPKMIGALSASWRIILGCSAIALVISFVWLVLLQFLGAAAVWLTVLLANLTMMGITAFLWYNYVFIKTGKAYVSGHAELDTLLANATTKAQNMVTTDANSNWFLAFAVIATAVTACVLLLSVFSCNRIRLACEIISEAGKSITAMPMIVFFPSTTYVALGLLFAWFLYIIALLASSGEKIVTDVLSVQTTNTYASGAQAYVSKFQPNNVLRGLELYYLFGLLWTMNWINAIGQCTIAGAIATWYWTRDKKALPRSPIWRSFCRTMRYHLGSLALGALIIAIVQFVRFILSQIQARLRGSENRAAQYILSCLQCCFMCLEKFLKFLNKNAYIMISIYGYSFFDGAKTAFNLLVRNAFRVLVIDGVTAFLLFLGKLLITSVMCLIGLAILQSRTSVGDMYGVPLLVIAVLSWSISTAFVSVVQMAVNTIFLCFCEDCERNDGTAARPYFMSDTLKAFTDKHQAPKV